MLLLFLFIIILNLCDGSEESSGSVEEVDGGPPVRDKGGLQSQGLQQPDLKIRRD